MGNDIRWGGMWLCRVVLDKILNKATVLGESMETSQISGKALL